MIADRDPVVERALDRLVPEVESDPEAILRRATTAAGDRRRRRGARTRRIAIVAVAAVLLLAGTALAAARFDVLPWFDSGDRSSATFSIDSSRTYVGPAPRVLDCPGAGEGSFVCSAGALPPHGRRAYELAERVEAQPTITRASALAGVAAAERTHAIDGEAADRIRAEIEAAGDDFFTALDLVAGVETIESGEQAPGRAGYELVPPSGVPKWVACESAGAGFRCHDLSSSRGVLAGTPLYDLQPGPDWVAVPRPRLKPVDVTGLFHAILGRDLTPAETQLLADVVSVATAGGGAAHTGTAPPPVTQPAPRSGG